MDKKIVREKLERKLLKEQETSLKNKPLKELIKEYHATIKGKKQEKFSKSNNLEALFTKKIKEAVQIFLQKKGKAVKESFGDEKDMDFDTDPTEKEPPVNDEFEGEESDKTEGDEDLDLEGDEDEDLDIDDEGNEDFDFEDKDDEDLDLGTEEGEEGKESEDIDLSLGDEEEDEGDESGGDEELDSEITPEDKNKEPEMTEAQKKKVRLDRIKAKAAKLAKDKVKEGGGAEAFDPSAGVDATLAGNKDLFDAIPDIESTGLGDNKNVPGDDLGTKDASTAPNLPMENTNAKKWNTDGAAPAEKATKQENQDSKWTVAKKTEKFSYKKLMHEGYPKKLEN